MEFEMLKRDDGVTYKFTESNSDESIEHIVNQIRQDREKFCVKNARSPEKIFMDALTYKKLEMSYGREFNSLGLIQFDEKSNPTIMGLNIEVLPIKQFFIMLGYNDCNNNVGLGLFG